MSVCPSVIVPGALASIVEEVGLDLSEPACCGAAAAPASLAQQDGITALLERLRQEDLTLYQHSWLAWAVSRYLARRLGISDEERTDLEQAALLHNVGKLLLPARLFAPSASLTAREWRLLHEHCERGAALLQENEVDESVVQLVLHHHERWDGRGYPYGRMGTIIPHGARLLVIADALVAMALPRPYQGARTAVTIREELRVNAGTQFDPQLAARCLSLLWQDTAGDPFVPEGEAQ